jgi:hypothetical protein
MPLLAREPEGGGDFGPRELIPEGLHDVICYSVYDLGTHANEYNGQVKNQRKVLIQWEFPGIPVSEEDPRPKVKSRRFTLSLHEKATLRKILQSWRGKAFTPEELEGFDIANLVGVAAQVQILHGKGKTDPSKTYDNVENVLPPSGKLNGQQPENPLVMFSFDDNGGDDLSEDTPEWIQNIIRDSQEWSAVPKEDPAPANPANAPTKLF